MTDPRIHEQVAEFERRVRDAENTIAHMRVEIEQLKTEAIHDRETALFSAAYFHTRLQEEILRSERYRHFLSLILVHIDLTHSASTAGRITRELRQLGLDLMNGLTRRTDIVAHFRNRQMIIMLPETDTPGASLLVSRFQQMFPDNGRRLTYSVLTYPNDASNIELTLNRLQEVSEDLFRQHSS